MCWQTAHLKLANTEASECVQKSFMSVGGGGGVHMPPSPLPSGSAVPVEHPKRNAVTQSKDFSLTRDKQQLLNIWNRTKTNMQSFAPSNFLSSLSPNPAVKMTLKRGVQKTRLYMFTSIYAEGYLLAKMPYWLWCTSSLRKTTHWLTEWVDQWW